MDTSLHLTPDQINTCKSLADLPGEVWRDVPGYEGKYQVSSLGRVKSLPRQVERRSRWGHRDILTYGGYIRSLTLLKTGYLKVTLDTDVQVYVHRLVTLAFLGQPPSSLSVNHKNGVTCDNRLENLEYVTQEQNIQHARAVLGRRMQAKLTPSQVREIRRLLMDGESTAKIADLYGITVVAVRAIKNGKTWKHVR